MGAKVTPGCHGYMKVFVTLQQNATMGRFLMAEFLLGRSDLIREHLVLKDLSDYYPNYYKYYILELIIIIIIIIIITS